MAMGNVAPSYGQCWFPIRHCLETVLGQVDFYDDARNFSYNSQVTIYRGEAPIIWLKGMVVRNLIVSIVEGSSDIHLKALRDLVEEETGIRAEQKRTKYGHVQPVR